MDNAELNKILPDNSEVTNIPRHSVKAIKNTRRKMEDRHICIRDFHGMFGVKDSEPTSFYGVFDGHGGQDAAIYTSAHLCYNIAKSSKYPHNIEAAMREAFLKTDDAFIDKSDKHVIMACISFLLLCWSLNVNTFTYRQCTAEQLQLFSFTVQMRKNFSLDGLATRKLCWPPKEKFVKSCRPTLRR